MGLVTIWVTVGKEKQASQTSSASIGLKLLKLITRWENLSKPLSTLLKSENVKAESLLIHVFVAHRVHETRRTTVLH